MQQAYSALPPDMVDEGLRVAVVTNQPDSGYQDNEPKRSSKKNPMPICYEK
jgi:hypothetical protein